MCLIIEQNKNTLKMENQMIKKNFDVQSIGLNANYKEVFEFVARPQNLPKWTNAFSSANEDEAMLVTPNGELPIKLKTVTSVEFGTIDWYMAMPDGSIGKAFSRVSENGDATIYTFTLLAPPVPLEQIEGALAAQIPILTKELKKLKSLLDHN